MSQLDKDFTRRLAFLLVETLMRRLKTLRFFRHSPSAFCRWLELVRMASQDIRNLLRYSDRQHCIACLRAAVKHYREQGKA